MSNDNILERLESQINRLEELGQQNGLDLSDEIERLTKKLVEAKEEHREALSDWDRVKLARHPNRPTFMDYLGLLMDDFYELHGDRLLGDDKALVGGLAKFQGRSVVVIGQQKGCDAEESKSCNFGMVRPEGYRKACRLMDLADRFSFPLITFIDTPGAYPGKDSERHNIGGTIARSISRMAKLEVPTIATVIGEGGSGGAVAIGVADRVLMLENSIYSVISPEGCAAILWKDKEEADRAASSLKLTPPDLFEMDLIDEIIEEGPDGAHENFEVTATNLKASLMHNLDELVEKDPLDLREKRLARYSRMGSFREIQEESAEQ